MIERLARFRAPTYQARYYVAQALVWLAYRINWVGAYNRAEQEDFDVIPDRYHQSVTGRNLERLRRR